LGAHLRLFEFSYFCAEVLSRLAQLGLREKTLAPVCDLVEKSLFALSGSFEQPLSAIRDAVYPLKAKGVPLNHEKAFAALNLPGDPESKMRVILAGQFTEAG
jgi:hypothetical protein